MLIVKLRNGLACVVSVPVRTYCDRMKMTARAKNRGQGREGGGGGNFCVFKFQNVVK